MKHPISISVINNAVGIPPSNNGVMGIFAKMVAVGTFQLNTMYLLTQLADLEALGVTAATDATNSTALHQQVSEFYAQAGSGALLWVYGIANATTFATFAASSAFLAAVKYAGSANDQNYMKMIGFCYEVPTSLNSSSDFPSDVLAAVTAINTAQAAHFALGYQWSAIVDGVNMSTADTPETLPNQSSNTAPSVSLCITSTLGNGVSQVGLALGRFARISLGHGLGNVSDGPVAVNTAFLTNSVLIVAGGTLTVGDTCTVFGGAITYNGTTYNIGQSFVVVSGHTTFTTSAGGYVVDNATQVQNLSDADLSALGASQYLFLRTWLNHSGFYWNDGATCCNSSLQLSTQEYNRVANALSADALAFFIGQIGQNLPLDTKTGNVDQTWLNAMQQQFYALYIAPLAVNAGGSGDITDASLTVTGVNFNSTKTLNFTLSIVPTPILGSVTGIIQFTATL